MNEREREREEQNVLDVIAERILLLLVCVCGERVKEEGLVFSLTAPRLAVYTTEDTTSPYCIA